VDHHAKLFRRQGEGPQEYKGPVMNEVFCLKSMFEFCASFRPKAFCLKMFMVLPERKMVRLGKKFAKPLSPLDTGFSIVFLMRLIMGCRNIENGYLLLAQRAKISYSPVPYTAQTPPLSTLIFQQLRLLKGQTPQKFPQILAWVDALDICSKIFLPV
jgi:hypothetical protein